jgi:hypothetical protein
MKIGYIENPDRLLPDTHDFRAGRGVTVHIDLPAYMRTYPAGIPVDIAPMSKADVLFSVWPRNCKGFLVGLAIRQGMYHGFSHREKHGRGHGE